MKVFISTTTFAEYDKGPLSLLEKNEIDYTLNPHRRKLSEAEIDMALNKSSYVGLIAGTEPLTAVVLRNAASLKVISRVGTGIDNIDLDAAKKLKIRIYNTPETVTNSVAELTIGLILSCLRRIPYADRMVRNNVWEKDMGLLFKDKILGIIGFGRIGRRVAKLSNAFGAHIIFYDRKNIKSKIAKQVSLGRLLKDSDIISLHTSSKESFVTAGQIQKAKNGVILINTSRGSAIDEDELYKALHSKKVGCAALDVFEREPYSGKLVELDNIILTPHIGSYAKEARVKMEKEAVMNLIKGLKKGN